jgi:hypothetical protein
MDAVVIDRLSPVGDSVDGESNHGLNLCPKSCRNVSKGPVFPRAVKTWEEGNSVPVSGKAGWVLDAVP